MIRAVVGFWKVIRPWNAKGVPQVPKAREGGEYERGIFPPLVRGVRGTSPEKMFEFKMPLEAILMHFETIFACETQSILWVFAVFQTLIRGF